MAIKARGEFTISVVNDGRGEKTYIRYSNDGGKTFTSFVENGDYGHGRNLFGFNLGIWNITCRVDKTINGYWAVKTDGIPKLCYLWKRRNSAMPAGIYRLSGLIRSDGNCTIELRMGGTPAREGSISVDNEWKPFSVTVNNTKALGAPDFGNIETKYLSGTTKVFIKNFMLTMGEDKYDYAPAPEDQDAGTFPGKYIGIMSWDKPYPPLDPSAYTWSAFQGQDAELYKLSPLEESAIVGNDGACNVILRYNVIYIAGSKASKYTGDDITINADSRLGALNFTKKATGEWECVTTIADFTTKNLGSFNVSVMKDAQVLDTRVIPVTYATQALLEANQKLGEVVASVRGVSKLIHNLLVGSTFLEPIEGVWSMNGAKVDDTLKYNNSNVVFIEEHGATQDTYHSLLFNVSGLAPNTAYTISAMVRTDNLASFTGGNNGAVLEVTQTTNGQRKRLFDPISIVPLTATTWGKVEHTFTTPSTLTSEVVEVKFMLLRNGRLWVSQPMMNQGNVAADYTANIKDIQLSLAQIKVTANTISQSVTDLSTGLESVGIHLSGTEKKITLHGDTEMVDANGKRVAMFKDGKIITEAINVDKVVADGVQGKTIDAKNATFENVNIIGDASIQGVVQLSTSSDSNFTAANIVYLPHLSAGTIENIQLSINKSDVGKVIRLYNSSIVNGISKGGTYKILLRAFSYKSDSDNIVIDDSYKKYAYLSADEAIELTCFSHKMEGGDGKSYVAQWVVTSRFNEDQRRGNSMSGFLPRVCFLGRITIYPSLQRAEMNPYQNYYHEEFKMYAAYENYDAFSIQFNKKWAEWGSLPIDYIVSLHGISLVDVKQDEKNPFRWDKDIIKAAVTKKDVGYCYVKTNCKNPNMDKYSLDVVIYTINDIPDNEK